MLLLRSLISLTTFIFTLSFLSTAEALHARAQGIETTTKTVRETSTRTDFKTTTKTTTVDKTRTKTTTDFKTTTETTTDFKTTTETTTATQDVTINHTTTTTKTISVTGSGSTCPTSTSTSTSRSVGCAVASMGGFVTGCSASSSVSTTSSISISHTSNTCPAPSTITTTITQSSSSTCPPTIPASTVTSTSTTTITRTQSGSSTCPTTPPSTQTVTSVSTATTTVTVTATATAQPTCPQLVYNPGFETGSFAGWTNANDNPDVTVIVAASSSIQGGAHSGSYAAEWYSNPAGPFFPGMPSDFSQTITIPQLCSAEQQYAFQAFVKTAANTCYVNAYDNGSGMSFVSILLGPGGTDPAWVEMSATITPGAGSFQLVLEAACQTMDPVWIDDITLTPI